MKVGTFGGIGVHIHWSFWLLIVAYMLSAATQSGWQAGVNAAIFVLSVFACIVAHEFGHAYAARIFGIGTADITLLPIGGVARLKRIPEKPFQELVIALAGPAVNVVIAGVLFVLLILGVSIQGSAPGIGAELVLMDQLIAANIVLVVFNMLPAFPMDGGRVLRSLLAMRMPHLRATQIAAKVGRWMAILFAVVAIIYGPLTLLLVAAFIFIAGTAELMSVRLREAAKSQAGGFDLDGFGQGAGGGNGFPADQSPTPEWYRGLWPDQGPQNQSQPFPNQGQQPRPQSHSPDGDIIDAVDVREIK